MSICNSTIDLSNGGGHITILLCSFKEPETGTKEGIWPPPFHISIAELNIFEFKISINVSNLSCPMREACRGLRTRTSVCHKFPPNAYNFLFRTICTFDKQNSEKISYLNLYMCIAIKYYSNYAENYFDHVYEFHYYVHMFLGTFLCN